VSSGFPAYPETPPADSGGASAEDPGHAPTEAQREPGTPPDEGDLASRIPSLDLRRAVVRVLERWREQTTDEARGREAELTDQLVELAESISSVQEGESLSRNRDKDGLALQRRLLELLRRELILLWDDHPESRPDDPDRMSTLLAAFEAVAQVLAPRWDETFGVALSGPSGLELAVEVAHDFRSPLSSVLFLADTLRSGGSGELNELQHRQLSLIYSAALSMVSMAGDVVDLGRGGESMAEREPVQFSVAEVMESVRSMVEPMVEAKGLSLAVTPPRATRAWATLRAFGGYS
jgi:signal transduction histidine kinase